MTEMLVKVHLEQILLTILMSEPKAIGNVSDWTVLKYLQHHTKRAKYLLQNF